MTPAGSRVALSPWVRGVWAAMANVVLLVVGAWILRVEVAMSIEAAAVIGAATFLAAGEAAMQTGDDGAAPAGLAAVSALLLGAVLVCSIDGAIETAPLAGAGISLMLAGASLRIVAVRQLGAGFVTDMQPARLMTRGVYRWLRHPSEAGLLLFALGAVIVAPTITAFVLFAGLAVLAWVRMRREERGLRAAFGPQYGDYAQRVPAIVPWRSRFGRA